MDFDPDRIVRSPFTVGAIGALITAVKFTPGATWRERAEARATATHTARMVRLQDDWTGRGLTVKTDADTPLDVKTAP